MKTWSNKIKKLELRNKITELALELARSSRDDTSVQYIKKLDEFSEKLNNLLKI